MFLSSYKNQQGFALLIFFLRKTGIYVYKTELI